MSAKNELGLIGAVLVNQNILFELYQDISPDMFVDNEYKAIFNEMLAMYDNHIDINPIELTNRLQDKFNPGDIAEDIKEAISSVGVSHEGYSHAKIIRNEHKARTLKEAIKCLTYNSNNIDNEIAEISQKLEELLQNRKTSFKSFEEIVNDNKDEHFIDKEVRKIYTGFDAIDSCFGGLEGGEMIVIGARPGVGKSALVTQIITNMSEKGIRVGYFNLEMSYKQIYERVICRYSGIELSRIKNAKYFLGNEKEVFNKANEKVSFKNLIVTSGSRSMSEIKAESRHLNYDVIVIDYLQLIKPDRTFGNRASEVGAISKAIKELAMELNVPVIALSQMNRVNDEKTEPNITDLRESGDIEQDASIIAMMWNYNDTGLKGFKVGKNRQGELTKIGLQFDGKFMSFNETGELTDNTKESQKEDNPFA